MELTDENQDGMDCRPLRRETGIEAPAWLKQRLKQNLAKPTAPKPPADPAPPKEP